MDGKHEAQEVVTVVVKRAWTDLEPKFVAWLTGGGLLTAASIVYGYIVPDSPVPFWVPLVVTWLGGAIVAYIKKSKLIVPVGRTEDGTVVAAPLVAASPVREAEGTFSTDEP